MKKNLLFIAVFISFVCIAQNIESKIPNSAEAVISINGDRLLDLVSITEFNDYSFAKEMFNKLNRNRDSSLTINSIEDLGFDLNSKAFYYYKKTDSISYHNFLVKLTGKIKFESLLTERDKEKIISEGGIRMMADNSSIVLWDDTMLLFSGYEKQQSYLRENMEPEDYKFRKKITSQWAKTYAMGIFKGNGETSILNDASYRANKDKNAVASVWFRNYGQLMEGAMAGFYREFGLSSLPGLQSASNLYGFTSIAAHLYFDKDAMRFTTEMEVGAAWEKIFKSFYNAKMDKNFYNYFNQNDVIAYLSLSTDIQAVLEEYPALLTNMYGALKPEYKEEISIGADFLSLLLDEEAIGELMTGDLLFVLNGFKEEEVTYRSYEYDEDYIRKDITKTKKEVVPDFTIMIGSKKEELLNKVARLGIKYELTESKAGYYKLNVPKNEIPVDLYAAIKNDILFFTTSEENILNIVNNRFVKNLGQHQKLLKNSSAVFYMNGDKLMSEVPSSELSKKERRYLNYTKGNFKDAYFRSSKMKGNKVSSEIKINTSRSQENSLKVFTNFMEMLSK